MSDLTELIKSAASIIVAVLVVLQRGKLQQIHALTNSNLTAVTTDLSLANEKINKLNDKISRLEELLTKKDEEDL